MRSIRHILFYGFGRTVSLKVILPKSKRYFLFLIQNLFLLKMTIESFQSSQLVANMKNSKNTIEGLKYILQDFFRLRFEFSS
jgi:hypothetical protein